MKFLLIGNYGATNLGDEIILNEMINLIREKFKNANITVFSANPVETVRNHPKIKSQHPLPFGFRSLFRMFGPNGHRSVKTIKDADYMIIGGGGLFSGLSLYANLLWGFHAFVGILFGKKIIMYSQSIGPVKWGIQRIILKYIFQKSTFISVRDPDSKAELEKMKIKKEIHLMPDMIFRARKPKTSIKKENNQILVNLRSGYHNQYQQKELRKFLNWLNKKGYQINFVPFQNKIESDKDLTEKFQQKLPFKTKIHTPQNLEEVLDLYKNAEYIIATRLHAALAAIKSESPLISIAYSQKVNSYLSQIAKDIPILSENLTFESLKTKFQSAKNSTPIYKKYNATALKEHKKIEKKLIDILV